MLKKQDSIFITGHTGLVGSSIFRRLKYFGYKNIITISSKKLDLRDQKKFLVFLKETRLSQ